MRKKIRYLVAIIAVCLALVASGPCLAISYKAGSFDPATPAETARWLKLLGRENEGRVAVKSKSMHLIDVDVSITRIEGAGCNGDVCPTFFRYEMDKGFEFVIPCKEGMVIFDRFHKDPDGKVVVEFGLDVGSSLTTMVRPTSLGPVIRTVRRLLQE